MSAALRNFLKKLLLELAEMIDAGDCDNLTPEDLKNISEIIHPPRTMGREAAALYLGLSLNKFHEYRDLGLIKDPKPRKGFKEKEYHAYDLDNAKIYIDLYFKKTH